MSAARYKLTAEAFYEQLARNTTSELAADVQALVGRLREAGLEDHWASTSVSMRLPNPGSRGGGLFTVLVLTTTGKFYLGWLDRVGRSGYPDEIALTYSSRIAAITGTQMKYGGYASDPIDVNLLLMNRDHFLSAVGGFVRDVVAALRAQEP